MDTTPKFCEVTLPDWESAKKIKNRLGSFIFRGQSSSTWDLETSLERALKPFRIPPNEMWYLEKKILFTFRSRAHHYIQSPPQTQHYIEWLALIQHYGGVTRLLDFTESFYIAWYFALENSLGKASVWAVNQSHLLIMAHSVIGDLFTHSPDPTNGFIDIEISDPTLDRAEEFVKKELNEDVVLPVKPSRLNERMAIQKGIFLLPCNLRKSFEKNLISALNIPVNNLKPKSAAPVTVDELLDTNIVDDISILKMNLQRHWHPDAISDLYSMNIDAASLFPGLEGFARSLKYSVRLREQMFARTEEMELDGYGITETE